MISFDLETHKIQPGLLSPPIVCGSFADRLRGTLYLKEETLSTVKALLESPDILAGANIAYDFGCVAAERPDLLPLIFAKYQRGEIHDVLIAQMLHLVALGCVQEGELLDPRTGAKLKDPSKGTITGRVSLAVCVDLCLGRSDAKRNDRFRTSYALLEGVPLESWPEDARQYPIDDAVNTLEVAEWQVSNCRNLVDLPAQCETAFALHLSSMWGLRTNPTKVAALEKTLNEKRVLDVEFAKKVGFMRQDGTKDTAKIKEAVRSAYSGNPPTTEKGAISCARETLEESGDDDLKRLSELSGTEKLQRTYLPVLREASTGPLNIRCNILIANGRSSYDGIVQTMPRKGPVRECFESRPGYTWCSVDWAAIELSTLAQVCLWTVGESKLAEAINEGLDPHSLFASQMSDVPYETFVDGLMNRTNSDLRQAAKAGNFGLPGMMGPFKFVLAKRKEGLRICQLMHTADVCGQEMITEWKGRTYSPACKACVQAADTLKTNYLYRQWIEMPKYFAWVTSQLDKADELEQFISKRVRGGLNGPSAANTLFSGLAADMAKSAVRQITRECYLDGSSPLFGSRLVLFTHDETMLEIPDENLTAAAERQNRIMLDQGLIYCPDVKVKSEPAVMKTWFKDAKTVYKDGMLVPWYPSKEQAA